MKERLTLVKDDNIEGRIPFCPVEDWVSTITDGIDPDCYVCEDCPFMMYINKLAEYEDKEEMIEDDLK